MSGWFLKPNLQHHVRFSGLRIQIGLGDVVGEDRIDIDWYDLGDDLIYTIG